MHLNTYRDLEDGEVVEALGYDIIIQRRSLGALYLPTGKLVACDPLTHPSTEPFSFTLPPGNYPVRVAIAQLRDDARLAHAVLEVAPAPARRWELATVAGEDTSPLSEDAHGYSVVSSLGCFMDVATATRLMEHSVLAKLPTEDELIKIMAREQRKAEKRGHTFLKLEHEDLGRHNIMLFSAGYGEGLYRTWVGMDERDRITRIVTDFEILKTRFPSFGF